VKCKKGRRPSLALHIIAYVQLILFKTCKACASFNWFSKWTKSNGMLSTYGGISTWLLALRYKCARPIASSYCTSGFKLAYLALKN
jgi:hypothetical protein